MKTANEYLSREALISKLEASQRELAEAQKSVKEMNHVLAVDQKRWQKTTADLRKQLAEAKELLAGSEGAHGCGKLLVEVAKSRDKAQEQLADAEKELAGEWKKAYIDAEKAYNKAQAEVKRLRTERNEWEITAKNYASNILKRDTEQG